MDINAVAALCQSFAGVTADYPFGPDTCCYRVGRRIFAQLCPNGIRGALTILLGQAVPREQTAPMLTLCCEPLTGDFYRCRYPGIVLRPYHSPPAQQPYANTILLDRQLPDEILQDMIAHAFYTALHKLPKKQQAALLENTKEE